MNEADGFRSYRVLLALILAVVVGVGGTILERGLGPRTLTATDVPDDVSGAWFCPHGGGPGWRAWAVIANPAPEPADVRVVTYGADRPEPQDLRIEAGTQVYVEVPADEGGVASAVEYFGGPVAAGYVVARPEGRGAGAEPCAETSGTTWYLTDVTTLRGFNGSLVVMNPFAERAVFDVILSDDEELLRPGELTGVVLEPRRSIGFDLGAFALERRILTVTVQVDLGKVAAGGLGISEGGLRATLPVREPELSWVLPGVGDEAPSVLSVLTPRTEVAPFRVRAQGTGEQQEVLTEVSAPAFRGEAFEVAVQDAGLLAVAEGPRPFLAQRRIVRQGDLASVGGVPEGATRWVALPATPPEGGEAQLLLENPGDQPAELRLSLLTAEGPAEAPSIARVVLPAGRQRALPLQDLVGTAPVSILVEADSGVVVVGQAGSGAAGFAVAIGARV